MDTVAQTYSRRLLRKDPVELVLLYLNLHREKRVTCEIALQMGSCEEARDMHEGSRRQPGPLPVWFRFSSCDRVFSLSTRHGKYL